MLFKGWVPCTPARYYLSLLVIVLASAAVSFVKAFRCDDVGDVLLSDMIWIC